MNEEDIKIKSTLPYLKDLGFDLSEISFEDSFTIRLGHKKETIRGYSDILCKRNGDNLFIIEIKRNSHAINDEDIKQATSYAKALENNIAPFTIITNGKTKEIYDSITRKKLTGTKISGQSAFWKNGCTLSIDEEEKIRYEALMNFISFSSENLKLFCEKEVQDRMGPIVGNINNPYSKFVKELYLPRTDLQSMFDKFINSNSKVFGIVGSAGVGKTNVMCSLALQYLNDEFVFFYNATIIDKLPLEEIAYDLNLAFSSKKESDIVLKKLNELGRYIDKNILIFIDAIDEHIDPKIALELSDMALVARNLDKIKICVSCKSNIWKDVLIRNNTPTHLFEELCNFHDRIESLDNNPGFLLTDFNKEELKDIIPLYKRAFGFKGEISESLLNELRNGFFLRIFSEVYSQEEIPEAINDKELIKKYIAQSLQRANVEPIEGFRILSEIGKILIKQTYKFWEAHKDEGLEVNTLLEKLNYLLDATLPEYLFARNILIKSSDEDSYNVSFYYSKIRDYIICFHSYKLDKLNDDNFYNILENFYHNYIGISAIDFYIENAPASHRNTLIKFKKDKAVKYVNGYNSYLNENFKTIKNLFDPKTDDDIGIILPKDLLRKNSYALFPIGSNLIENIQYDDFEEPFPIHLLEQGINTVHGSNNSLMVQDQRKIIQQNIFKQLKEIIKKGSLTAYNSDILLLEEVALILYYYYQKLGYDFKIIDFRIPRYELIYPIDLNDVREKVYNFIATRYYQGEDVNPNLIPQLVEDAFKKNLEIPKLNIGGDFPPFEELFKIVNILLEKGYDKIEKHHLPYPDKSVIETKTLYEQNKKGNIDQIIRLQFSEAQAKLYIETFFKHLEICYKEFVEYCFPTLKNEFSFYNTLPHEYFFYPIKPNKIKWGQFSYKPSICEKTKINFKYTLPAKPFDEDKITFLRGFSLDRFLYNDYYHRIKTIDRINTSNVDDFCVIRNWVYRLLNDDMKKILKDNDVNI